MSGKDPIFFSLASFVTLGKCFNLFEPPSCIKERVVVWVQCGVPSIVPNSPERGESECHGL